MRTSLGHPRKIRKIILFASLFIAVFGASFFFPVWNDEHVFVRFAWEFIHRTEFGWKDLLLYSKQAFHPPLHLFFHVTLSAILDQFGLNWSVVLRAFSALASASAIYLLYRRTSAKILLVAVIPFFAVYYSFQIGPYPYLMLAATVYLLAAEKLWITPDRKQTLRVAGAATVLSYIHYFGTLLTLVVGTSIIVARVLRKPRRWDFLTAHLLAFIAFLPWLVHVASRVVSNEVYGPAFIKSNTVFESQSAFLAAFQNGSLFGCIFFICWAFHTMITQRGATAVKRMSFYLWIFLACILAIFSKGLISTSLARAHLALAFYPGFLLLFHETLELAYKENKKRWVFLAIYFLISFDFNLYSERMPVIYWERNTEILKERLNQDKASKAARVFYVGTSVYDLAPYRIPRKTVLIPIDFSCNQKPAPNLVKPGDYFIVMGYNCEYDKHPELFPGWDILHVDYSNVILRKKQ